MRAILLKFFCKICARFLEAENFYFSRRRRYIKIKYENICSTFLQHFNFTCNRGLRHWIDDAAAVEPDAEAHDLIGDKCAVGTGQTSRPLDCVTAVQ